ncbi:MAG TPA: serine hydrolase domain-containing protein [Nocardioidaceae bacterium]|nr:serine hydrolase domain-containing protein [Nocardioidaceae bacterium]
MSDGCRPVADLTAHRLRALLAHEQATARLPSVCAGVVRGPGLVWTGEHGATTGTVPPSPDVQYRIGSITKTMTAVLVMQLRDEGQIDLADRLDHHLPGVGYGDRTIRSLLSHSSGMQSEPEGPWWERSPGVPFEELVRGIDGGRAAHPPGATYHYTNLAFGLLGELVARHRDVSWWDVVCARLLEPLGMARTSYLPEPPAATGYSVHHFAGTLTEEPAHDAGAMAPAGQVWSTVNDLALWARFLRDGDERVLSAATLQEMATPQSGSAVDGLAGGYGLGLRLVSGGSGMLVGHTGSMPGFLAGLLVDRPRGTAAVVLANGTSGLRCEGFPADLLATLEDLEPSLPAPWEPNGSVPAQVEEVLGVWHWGNTAFAFAWTGAELAVSKLSTGVEAHRFRPCQDGGFLGTAGYHHGERLHVVRDQHGTINHLECATFIYTRSPYDPAAPIPGGV